MMRICCKHEGYLMTQGWVAGLAHVEPGFRGAHLRCQAAAKPGESSDAPHLGRPPRAPQG